MEGTAFPRTLNRLNRQSTMAEALRAQARAGLLATELRRLNAAADAWNLLGEIEEAPRVPLKSPPAQPSLDPTKISQRPKPKAHKTAFIQCKPAPFSPATIVTRRAPNEPTAEVIPLPGKSP